MREHWEPNWSGFDPNIVEKFQPMTEKQRFWYLFHNPTTSLKNYLAYEYEGKLEYQIIIDIDILKKNDSELEKSTQQSVLQAVPEVFKFTENQTYHVFRNLFFIQADSIEEALNIVEQLEQNIKNIEVQATIWFEDDSKEVFIKSGIVEVRFYYGIGTTIQKAEENLNKNKRSVPERKNGQGFSNY